MGYCAEPSCRNGTGKGNKKLSPGVKLHCFPKDEQLARVWWQRIKRGEAFPSNFSSYYICSEHFAVTDYQRDLRHELLSSTASKSNMPSKKLSLLPDAIPSKNLIRPTSIPAPRTGAATRRADGSGCDAEQLNVPTQHSEPVQQWDAGTQTYSPGVTECTKCPSLEVEVANLKGQLTELQQQCAPAGGIKLGLFTDQQAAFLTSGKKPYRWDDESMYKALQVRLKTSRAQYEWLRSNCLPLPSLSTLQRWLAEFVLAPGSTEVQSGMLSKLLATMDLRDRCCVLMLYEMDIMGIATYDKQLDQILGPFKHLQLFLLGGIFKSWKFPMYYAFNQPATKEVVLGVIQDVEAAGGHVLCTVNDMGPGNLGLWKSLGIGHDREASFSNPADPSRRIWVMADPPHAMKRLRNHILDKTVHTRLGGCVNRTLIEDLIKIDGNAEFRLLHKLQIPSHVEVSGMARQKVRPAYETVSASCALALNRYKPDKKVESDFFSTIDSGMDVLNSGHPKDLKPLRRGYLGNPEKEVALTSLTEEMAAMRIGAARHLLQFQKGLLVTVRAVRGLLRDVQRQFGLDSYLLTRHPTQDKLESFFSLIRGRGGSSMNPTPTEAKARLRLLTLLQLARQGVSPKTRVTVGDPGPDECSQLEPGPDGEDASPPQDLLELESFCPEPVEEVPEGTEHMEPAPDEPAQDAEEEAEEAEMTENGEHLDTAEEMASLLKQAETVHVPGEPSAAIDTETGVPASESAMVYLAGYMARKRGPSFGMLAAAAAEDAPVQTLWTRLRSVTGGLTVPTASCLELFRQLEAEFSAYHAVHEDGLSRERGVIANVTSVLLSKHDSSSEETAKFISTFVRVRTFIRLRTLNANRRSESVQKRKMRKLRHHAQ